MKISYRVAPWFDIKKRKPIYWVQKRVGILWFNAYEDGQALKFDSELEAKAKISILMAENGNDVPGKSSAGKKRERAKEGGRNAREGLPETIS